MIHRAGISIKRSAMRLALLAAASLCGSARAELPQMPEPLAHVELADKPAGERWIWVTDFQGGMYGRSTLFNADTGKLLGMIDTGWEGIKLDFPRSGKEIYNHAMYLSRGFRGERSDVVTAYDRHTLQPLREVIVPPKGIHGLPDPNLSTLSDDDRFLFMQFFTPASSVGVLDLSNNRYAGEIETSGCAHIMAAGARRFFTLCGDGSALAVTIGEDGKETSRKRSAPFFDPDADPLHGSGTRSGSTWYFPSFRGRVHEVDVSGAELGFPPAWPITATEAGLHWVPGPLMQPVAVHHALRRLYVLMHPSDLQPKGGGGDFHRADATEIWAFDLDTKRRLNRIRLKNPSTTVAVSQDPAPVLYAPAVFMGVVTVYDEATGKPLRDISGAMNPTLIQPVD